jgi:L-alanine-DL-glutamate epimerase-like enolase superfamily enzyme
MRIARFETIRPDRVPQLTLVRLDTDEGLTGSNDTRTSAAVDRLVHQWIAPAPIGRHPLQIQRHRTALYDRGAARRSRPGADVRDDEVGRPDATFGVTGSADL